MLNLSIQRIGGFCTEMLKMNLVRSAALVAMLLSVVEGQINKWGAPFGCPNRDKVCA